jgi:hypothetical protein
MGGGALITLQPLLKIDVQKVGGLIGPFHRYSLSSPLFFSVTLFDRHVAQSVGWSWSTTQHAVGWRKTDIKVRKAGGGTTTRSEEADDRCRTVRSEELEDWRRATRSEENSDDARRGGQSWAAEEAPFENKTDPMADNNPLKLLLPSLLRLCDPRWDCRLVSSRRDTAAFSGSPLW